MLTTKQRVLLKIAEENGFVSVEDAYMVYSSKEARINALKLLVKLGHLEHSNNKFKFVKGEIL